MAHNMQRSFQTNVNITYMKKIVSLLWMLHLPTIGMVFFLMFTPIFLHNQEIAIALISPLPFMFSAMGAFVLNDFYDIEKDKISKPYRPLPQGIFSLAFAKRLGMILFLLAAFFSFVAAKEAISFLIYFFAIAGSIFYCVFINKIGYIKTLVTALVAICPYIVLLIHIQTRMNGLLFVISIYFSLVSKELLMDVRDIEGDLLGGMRTVAVLLGELRAGILSLLLFLTSIFFILCSVPNGFTHPYIFMGCISGLIIYCLWFFAPFIKRYYIIWLSWLPILFFSLALI